MSKAEWLMVLLGMMIILAPFLIAIERHLSKRRRPGRGGE
jgi:hypothetical protein